MATSVTYTSSAGTATLSYPIITVSQALITSAARQQTVSCRQIYSLKFLVTALSNSALEDQLEGYRIMLGAAKGTLTIDYDGFSSPIVVSPITDISDGPIPTVFNVDRFHGGKTAEVSWQIETEIFPSEYNSANGYKWVDFVYTLSTSIDPQFYARRNYSGFLRLPSNSDENAKLTADSFRDHVYATLPVLTDEVGYWQRISSDWRVSEDGRTLFFTINDVQRYALLPAGCTDGDAIISTNVTKDGNGSMSLTGWLIGTARESRGDIYDRAYEIMQLFRTSLITTIRGIVGDNLTIIEESCGYSQTWQSNRVDFNMNWSFYGNDTQGGIARKLEFLQGAASNWLAYLTNTEYGLNNRAVDLGAYGSSGAAGVSGTQEFAPLFNLSWDDKLPAKWVPGQNGAGAKDGGTMAYSASSDSTGIGILFCEQTFSVRVKSNRITIPVKSTSYQDMVVQTGKPEVYLLCTGEQVCADPRPMLPPIPYTVVDPTTLSGLAVPATVTEADIKAVIIDYVVMPSTPRPDGTFFIQWRYILKLYNYTVTATGLPTLATWPFNPQVPMLDGESFDATRNVWEFAIEHGRPGYTPPAS